MIGIMTRTVHRYGGCDLSRMERSWGGLGFDLVRWQIEDEAEGLTRRSEHLLFVTLSGTTGRTTARMDGGPGYDGADFPGATTFIPAMRQRWSAYRGGAIEYAAIRIDPALPDAIPDGPLEFTGFTNRADPFVHQLALGLGEETRQGGALGRLYAESVATTLSLHLIRRYSSLAGVVQGRKPPPPLTGAALRRVLDYMHDNLGDDLRLTTLAELAGVQRHYFSRCFKAATGLPPYRYVTERRLERAAQLLHGDRSIADIAYQLGFSSQSHLTTAFRRRYGTTPHAYRTAVKA